MLGSNLQNRKKYEIIIFGATSFTGKWLVHEVLKYLGTCEDENDDLKFSWAIAGRSMQKMEQLLLRIGRETRKDLLKSIDMIQADVFHPSSIFSMVQQCQIVLNCVGPYQKYGECVVKTCAEIGVHHLDLSGEPLFLGQMELRYGALAERSGAYIVGACGFDSIPVDCGALYLQQKFEGDVNSIESFIKVASDGSKLSTVHSGTWKSAIWAAHYILNYILLKAELNRNFDPPKIIYKLPIWPIQYRKEVDSWCVVTPFPDGEVLERTKRQMYQNRESVIQPVTQTKCYIQFPGLFYLPIFLLLALAYSVIAQVAWGARLLSKFPKLFTLGMFSDKGPSVEAMNQTKFTFTLVAKGWSESCKVLDKKYRSPPNKTKILRVKGTNPGYGATVTIFLQAALTILSERDKMPKSGGVYSPGTAFVNTSLIERLNRNGVTFQIEN